MIEITCRFLVAQFDDRTDIRLRAAEIQFLLYVSHLLQLGVVSHAFRFAFLGVEMLSFFLHFKVKRGEWRGGVAAAEGVMDGGGAGIE